MAARVKSSTNLPLVYSCSGASSAAQMANYLAVKLDRLKVAEMSCIAGLGGDVKPLVRTALSGRPIIVLDGCPLQCAAKILARHGLKADRHLDLSKLGVKKRQHEDFDPAEAACVLRRILDDSLFPGHAKPAAAAPARKREEVSSLNPPPAAADEEVPEAASPPCYLSEFGWPKSPV